MGREVERKFLVRNDNYKKEAERFFKITQGYLSSVPERTVRIRIKENKGFITIKGIANKRGTTRYEWEKEIPIDEARELLELCEPGAIEKIRYIVEVGSHKFEVDEFYGNNAGLVVAEIELADEEELFEKPEWLGEEVTGREEYFNSMLAKNPFKNWGNYSSSKY